MLHIPAKSHSVLELASLLLKNKANIKAEDKYNNTPFHLAAWTSNEPAVRLLLQYGADPMSRKELPNIPRMVLPDILLRMAAGICGPSMVSMMMQVGGDAEDEGREEIRHFMLQVIEHPHVDPKRETWILWVSRT